MNEVDRIFQLLKASLTGKPADASAFENVDASEWWNMFKVLQQNHVDSLASEAFLYSCQPPRDIYMPWIAEREKSIAWYQHQSNVEQELKQLLKKHNIECLTLKGTHIASYYRRPELRKFGDLDLYFYDKHNEADDIVNKELGIDITDDAPSHSRYDYRGVTIESHYDLINRHYPHSNRRYSKFLSNLIPSPDFDVLFFLRHTAGHFASARITLREICDWYCICKALNDKVDWPKIADTLITFGMDPFAAAMNAIVEEHFDYKIPLQLTIDKDTTQHIKHNIVYGNQGNDTHATDGIGRLFWKASRRHANAWKRRLVYNDSSLSLTFSNLTYHLAKPKTILHRM